MPQLTRSLVSVKCSSLQQFPIRPYRRSSCALQDWQSFLPQPGAPTQPAHIPSQVHTFAQHLSKTNSCIQPNQQMHLLVVVVGCSGTQGLLPAHVGPSVVIPLPHPVSKTCFQPAKQARACCSSQDITPPSCFNSHVV